MAGLVIGEYFNIYEVGKSGATSQSSRSHTHRDTVSPLGASGSSETRLPRSVGDKWRTCVGMSEAKSSLVLGLGSAAPNRARDKWVGTKPVDHHFDPVFSGGGLFCVELRSGGFLC